MTQITFIRKNCEDCGKSFTGSSVRVRFCPDCRLLRKRIHSLQWTRRKMLEDEMAGKRQGLLKQSLKPANGQKRKLHPLRATDIEWVIIRNLALGVKSFLNLSKDLSRYTRPKDGQDMRKRALQRAENLKALSAGVENLLQRRIAETGEQISEDVFLKLKEVSNDLEKTIVKLKLQCEQR